MPFIIETVVSTVGEDGQYHFAPMGIMWKESRLVIRPYTNTTTYRNLQRVGEAVVNLTDNVLIFAKSALSCESFPAQPATRVQGAILDDACSYYEVAVEESRDAGERATLVCRVVGEGWVRQFAGFNRAKNAVIEAAIVATRFRWLPAESVRGELQRCARIVEKTGGDQEREAFAYIQRYVDARIGAFSYGGTQAWPCT